VRAGPSCPVCHGAAGKNRLTLRAIGERKSYGIPLVAGVAVTSYEQVKLDTLCSGCTGRVFRGRWLAWLVALLPPLVIFGIAAATTNALVYVAALIASVLAFRGLFYSWADDTLWGAKLVQDLGLPSGKYHIPASVSHVLVRALVVPVVLLLCIGLLVNLLNHR